MEKKELNIDPIKVVAAVIVNNDSKSILVGQRADNQSHPYKYEFIGGKIEFGESPEEALIREVEEETGFKIGVGNLLDVAFADYRNLGTPSHQIIFFLCHLEGGIEKIDPNAYHKIEWINTDKLKDLDWIEANREFVVKLVESALILES